MKGELLESFTEIILGELEELSDIRDEGVKKLLVNALFQANLSVCKLVEFASLIDPSVGERFSIVYCCLNPSMWEDPWMVEYKKSMLDSYAHRSSGLNVEEKDYVEAIDWLKKYAKSLTEKFFHERNISKQELSGEESLKEKETLKVVEVRNSDNTSMPSSVSELEKIKENLAQLLNDEGKTNIVDSILSNKTDILKKNELDFSVNQKESWKINFNHSNWGQIYQMVKYSPQGKVVRSEKLVLSVVQAILYKLQNNCCWKEIPQWLPKETTVKHYYYEWKNLGKLEQLKNLACEEKSVSKTLTANK